MCFASALSSLCLPKLRSRTQGDQVKVDLVRIGRHVVLLHKVCSALQETFAARAALDRSTPAPIELHELAVRAAHQGHKVEVNVGVRVRRGRLPLLRLSLIHI